MQLTRGKAYIVCSCKSSCTCKPDNNKRNDDDDDDENSYIIGEHGDSSVPVWSNVNIAGTRLKDIHSTAGQDPYDHEKWNQAHKEVVSAAYEIIKLKGYTNWGIGIMSAKLANAIIKNQVFL